MNPQVQPHPNCLKPVTMITENQPHLNMTGSACDLDFPVVVTWPPPSSEGAAQQLPHPPIFENFQKSPSKFALNVFLALVIRFYQQYTSVTIEVIRSQY